MAVFSDALQKQISENLQRKCAPPQEQTDGAHSKRNAAFYKGLTERKKKCVLIVKLASFPVQLFPSLSAEQDHITEREAEKPPGEYAE